MDYALYLHTPFCVSRCSYCDFYSTIVDNNFSTNTSLWLEAVKHHFKLLQNRFKPDSFTSIYFGGGSPSCLPPSILLEAVSFFTSGTFKNSNTEITIEANPEDIDDEWLRLIFEAGVNRLSLGVQSLEPNVRKIIDRRGHNIKPKLNAVASFCLSNNITLSADLIYGFPEQSVKSLCDDINYISSLGFEHISLYELMLESGTKLHTDISQKKFNMPSADASNDMYVVAKQALHNNGFTRYEVSNWAKNNKACKHNLVYWNMGNWLALGPSAVSNINTANTFIRIENVADIKAYCLEPEKSAHEYRLAENEAVLEYCMTALRTAYGLDINQFKNKFNLNPVEVFGALHKMHPSLIYLENDIFKATDLGLDLLNIPLVSALKNIDVFFGAKI